MLILEQVEETSFTNEDKNLIKNSRRSRRNKESIDEGKDNKAYVTEKENADESPKVVKKSRRRKANKKTEEEAEEDESTKPRDSNILAVIIHQSDKLKTDVNIYHPMVRVHIIDIDNDGEYVKKLDR